jgi:hypothetical protein
MREDNYIGQATEELYNIFDIINRQYFGGVVNTPIITIMKTKPNIGGHFSLDKIWKRVDDKSEVGHEINISAYWLSHDILAISHILCHEMCHAMNKQNGIKDCSGQVHNKKFMHRAVSVGLDCKKVPKIGWTTEPGAEFSMFIASNEDIRPEVFALFRDNYVKPESEKDKPKNVKFTYRCTGCGKSFTSKNDDISALCNDCDVEFEQEEKDDAE